ncbi:hypothetical protein [Sphingomonas sp. PB1R3]|uniref:hypothetical protein n=1 Tax=Sphingomonas flavida TaxID=3096154 RepID=UPI002FC77DE3
MLHILGEKCGDPQDMYHWGLPALKRNPDGTCTIPGDHLARVKRIVSPTYLKTLRRAGDVDDYRDYPVRFAVFDGAPELTRVLPIVLSV